MTFSAPMVRKADTPNVLLREACKLCYALCREGQELRMFGLFWSFFFKILSVKLN